MNITLELTPDVLQTLLLKYANSKLGAYNKSWAWWAYDTSSMGHTIHSDLLVEVVQVTEPESDSYGNTEGAQKDIVFKVTDLVNDEETFFMKTGTATSYGQDEWTGTFKEVFPEIKTVYSYK